MMSANITAASTSWRRTGCSVTSAHSSGCAADVEEAVALADRAVLGQRPAGLPHEPHRCPLDRLSPAGSDEKRLGHPPRLVRCRDRSSHAGSRGCSTSREPARAAPPASRSRTPARPRGATTSRCSYHWLDPLGNPIYWDGIRTPLPRPVAPEERITLRVDVRAPIPPGRYRFALDLVAEHRAWFAELGQGGPEDELEVRPRVEAAALDEVADVDLPPGWVLAPAPPSSRLPPTPKATPSWRRPSIRRAACAVRSNPGATTPAATRASHTRCSVPPSSAGSSSSGSPTSRGFLPSRRRPTSRGSTTAVWPSNQPRSGRTRRSDGPRARRTRRARGQLPCRRPRCRPPCRADRRPRSGRRRPPPSGPPRCRA